MIGDTVWREVAMGDVCEEITVGFVGPMTSEYREAGVPFLRSMNIEPFRINKTDLKFVSPAFHARISKSRLRAGDVVIVRTGAPGTAAVVPDWMHDGNCSDLVIARPGPGVDARFLCYYVNAVTHHIVNEHVVGAVQQHFNVGAAKSLKLPLPPLPEQRAIARVLGGLDDKIELNRRMNRTLEDLARGVSRSWFVDFDPVLRPAPGPPSRPPSPPPVPPAHRGGPASPAPRSAPAAPAPPHAPWPTRLTDSPLGPIPEGWRVGTVGELCDLTPGKSYTSEELQDSETALVTLKSFERGGGYRRDGLKGYTGGFKPQQVLQVGELIVARTDVTQNAEVIGRAAIVGPTSQYKRLVASLDVLIVRPRDTRVSVPFLYFLMRETDYENHIVGHANGTTVLHLSKEGVPTYSFALPTPEVVAAFSAFAQPMMDRMASNDLEAVELAALRDALLPQLLSGEIRLREADRAVDDALRSTGTSTPPDRAARPGAGTVHAGAKGRA